MTASSAVEEVAAATEFGAPAAAEELATGIAGVVLCRLAETVGNFVAEEKPALADTTVVIGVVGDIVQAMAVKAQG